MNRMLNYPGDAQDPVRADLVLAREDDVPLVVFFASGELLPQIRQACSRQSVPHFHLLLVNVNDWNALLSCWPARNGETFFAGHGDITRQFLETRLLPWALDHLPAKPDQIWLGGYSQGGLFALWAGLQSPQFQRLLCVSGSVWFEHFEEWAMKQPVGGQLKSVYFSLGTKEVKTGNPLLQKTGEIMETLCSHFQSRGIDSTLVWNPGTHFTEVPGRIARAIGWTFSVDAEPGSEGSGTQPPLKS